MKINQFPNDSLRSVTPHSRTKVLLTHKNHATSIFQSLLHSIWIVMFCERKIRMEMRPECQNMHEIILQRWKFQTMQTFNYIFMVFHFAFALVFASVFLVSQFPSLGRIMFVSSFFLLQQRISNGMETSMLKKKKWTTATLLNSIVTPFVRIFWKLC